MAQSAFNAPQGGVTNAFAETPSGTINGTNTAFTLANTPADVDGVLVLLDGVTQYNGIDFTVSGNTITFAVAPATSSTIFVYYNTFTAGGGGTVTNVASANGAITVTSPTTSPILTSVYAPALKSATTTVSVAAATAPTTGQVLTASSGTAAIWSSPDATQTAVTVASGDFTTTSGTLVDVTNLTVTLTTTGGDVLVMAIIPCKIGSAGIQGLFDFGVDGTATGGIKGVFTNQDYTMITLFFLKTGLSAASHTFNIKTRNSNGAATITIPMSSVCNGQIIALELKN